MILLLILMLAIFMFYKKALKIKNDDTSLGKLNSLIKQESYQISIKDLQKYTGVYTIEAYNIDIILYIQNNKLWSKVPAQVDSEFVPISKNTFTIKDKQGYFITFKMEGEKPLWFTSVQPNGTFKMVFKNE